MAKAVIGNGPIGFTDENGKQQSIPLSLLCFEDGLVKADKWKLYDDNKQVVDALLKSLVAGEFLKPAPTPPPKPAIALKAARPGTEGNTIQVTFSYTPTDPTKTSFDAEITAKATYSGLSFDPGSPSFVGTVLGIGGKAGTSPGLVQVKETPPTATLPKIITNSKPLMGGGASAQSLLPIDGDPSGTAFILEAWKKGVDGNNIKITIPNVDPVAETFTLVVEWAQSKIISITLADLPLKLAGNEFVIQVSKPENGDFGIPAPGRIILNGGSDAQAPSPAKAVAFSS
jgi:hypothetical protein